MRIVTAARSFSQTRGTPRKKVGCTSPQVGRQVVARLAEVDDVAIGDGIDDRYQPLGDVAQRQVREHLVIGPATDKTRPTVARPRPGGWRAMIIAPLGGPVVPDV